jgi:myo-inositol 2-dehydrogenase / D-chiro-inositol 1-dehydrogenase
MNQGKAQIDRRSFLKTSTALVGGTLLGGLPLERSVHAAGDDTLKVCLIGCGGRGTGAATQALSTAGSVKLVAMADAFEDNLAKSLGTIKAKHPDRVDVPKENQFSGFDGYKNAIALADVVILATPPGFRPIHFEEAVRQGKHVFMEKPVAVDAPGVRRILAVAEDAKKKNLKIGVGLQRRHQEGYMVTVKRLHDGAIGDLVSMSCYWNGRGVWVRDRKTLEEKAGRRLTEMEYQMRNWYYFVWLCGDHIVEQHIHSLDVINWVKKGYPVRAQGMGGREVRNGIDHGEIFDHHFAEFEYADGSRLYSQCRHIPGCMNQISEHFQGTKGSCDMTSNKWTIQGEKAWSSQDKRDPQQTEHDDLFAAIRNDRPFNGAEVGAKSTMTAILGRMCTYSGQKIEWEAALNSKIDLMPKRFAWDAEPPVLPNKDGRYPVAVPGQTVAV